jgi:hypothetical protein
MDSLRLHSLGGRRRHVGGVGSCVGLSTEMQEQKDGLTATASSWGQTSMIRVRRWRRILRRFKHRDRTERWTHFDRILLGADVDDSGTLESSAAAGLVREGISTGMYRTQR